jgi:hypothetical protein
MIQVGLLVCIVAFLAEKHILEVIKECMKKDARDGSSLVDLHPTGRVVSCCWHVGIIPSKNKGHALFLKSWV